MRHKKKTLILSRKTGPRTALLRTLAVSFIEHERIQTTPAKAKALREFVEPLVTVGKEKTPQSIRLIEQKLSNKKAALHMVNVIGPRFRERNGGYTRTTKIGTRKGDGSEQVILEFVS